MSTWEPNTLEVVREFLEKARRRLSDENPDYSDQDEQEELEEDPELNFDEGDEADKWLAEHNDVASSESDSDTESVDPDEEEEDEEEMFNGVKNLIDKITDKTKTKNEEICLEAIKLLFDNVNDLEIINKRAAMIYIRNITNMSPKQLSIVLSVLKKYYKEIKREIKNIIFSQYK